MRFHCAHVDESALRIHAWGVELDELDVPYVVRYRVRR
jgi:hypothetical protein